MILLLCRRATRRTKDVVAIIRWQEQRKKSDLSCWAARFCRNEIWCHFVVMGHPGAVATLPFLFLSGPHAFASAAEDEYCQTLSRAPTPWVVVHRASWHTLAVSSDHFWFRSRPRLSQCFPPVELGTPKSPDSGRAKRRIQNGPLGGHFQVRQNSAILNNFSGIKTNCQYHLAEGAWRRHQVRSRSFSLN